jgi:hypothetical protein
MMQSRRNAAVGMNPITAKNKTIVTLHLDDEECGSKRVAPYGELHGNDTPSLHRVALHAVKCKISLHELIVPLPSFLKMVYGIRFMVAPPSMSILETGSPLM